MRILLLTRYFPPEIGTAATLFSELARGLVRRGHRVTVATGFPWYNLSEVPRRYRERAWMKEMTDGVRVVRLSAPVFGSKAARLALGHLTAPLVSFLGGLSERDCDVIYAYSPPLPMGLAATALGRLRKVPFVLGLQDIHPQCYIDQGMLKNVHAIRALEGLERFVYRQATAITVHSEGNRDHIINLKRADPQRVVVVPNWVDTDVIRPLPRRNPFGHRYGLDNHFVVSYAGALSISQGLLTVVEAAHELRDQEDLLFLVVGDGIEKGRMMERAGALQLKNVKFLPMQPLQVYPSVLASSDVSLALLNGRVRTPVIPSKILSIMAASRPVVASMPLDGDAARLIERAGCGITVPPEEPRALADALLRLREDAELRQRCADRGRAYVVANFSLNRAVRTLEALFAEVLRASGASCRTMRLRMPIEGTCAV